MAHRDNLNYLEQLKKSLGESPGAGKIATIINEYRSVIDSRLEHKCLEIGGSYEFTFTDGQELSVKIEEVGTYNISGVLTTDDSKRVLLFKSAIMYVFPEDD